MHLPEPSSAAGPSRRVSKHCNDFAHNAKDWWTSTDLYGPLPTFLHEDERRSESSRSFQGNVERQPNKPTSNLFRIVPRVSAGVLARGSLFHG